jgi:CheY-like chemotaxis protein
MARVLLLEPDPDVRFVIRLTLAGVGHEVEAPADGDLPPPGGRDPAAPPDLLILGFEGDGEAAPFTARARADFPATPILALVTSSVFAVQAQVYAAGASRVALLPVDLDDLVREVESLLTRAA